jgi:hypothetical protein
LGVDVGSIVELLSLECVAVLPAVFGVVLQAVFQEISKDLNIFTRNTG